jgi:hypothetical protein
MKVHKSITIASSRLKIDISVGDTNPDNDFFQAEKKRAEKLTNFG